MTDEVVIQSNVPKKRGRPRKDGQPTGSRPLCEKSELAKYPNPDEFVGWGMEPQSPRFKRKGVAVLYNPSDPGGQITIMPVTNDDGGMRWRYRKVPGPMPYHYDMVPLEPGEAFALLNELAACLKKYFDGDVKVADKTTEEFHNKIKADELGDKIKRLGIF